MPAVIRYSQEQSFQIEIGGRGGENSLIIIVVVVVDVFFGEERRRKPYTCPFSRDEEYEFKLHLSGLILGLTHASLAI